VRKPGFIVCAFECNLCRYSAEEEKLRKRKKEADAKKGKFGNVSSKIDLD
jgi:hypothetical protein